MKSKISVFAIAVALGAACRSDDAVVPGSQALPVSQVSVTAATGQLSIHQSSSAIAVPVDANGAPLTGRTITWQSSNSAIATVVGSSSGVGSSTGAVGIISAVAAGTVTITATSEGKTGSAPIVVTPNASSLIVTLSPALVTLSGSGAKQAITVTGITEPDAVITYAATSSNGGVAVVASSGNVQTVTAMGGGIALITITATIARPGVAPVTVTGAAAVTVGGQPIVPL